MNNFRIENGKNWAKFTAFFTTFLLIIPLIIRLFFALTRFDGVDVNEVADLLAGLLAGWLGCMVLFCFFAFIFGYVFAKK